jgi:hypothetical protein
MYCSLAFDEKDTEFIYSKFFLIIPNEFNYVLNPHHAKHKSFMIIDIADHAYDLLPAARIWPQKKP